MDEQVSTATRLIELLEMSRKGITEGTNELLDYIIDRLRAIDICWEPSEGE